MIALCKFHNKQSLFLAKSSMQEHCQYFTITIQDGNNEMDIIRIDPNKNIGSENVMKIMKSSLICK
jgi:hypothetical protein